MPFKSGKSPINVSDKLNKELGMIADVKLKRANKIVGLLIAARADQYVPIDTNALLNSREVKTAKNDGGYRTTIGYYQDYAAALHSPKAGSKLDGWKPKKNKTGGFNPRAKQGWIDLGLAEVWPDKVREVYAKELNRK